MEAKFITDAKDFCVFFGGQYKYITEKKMQELLEKWGIVIDYPTILTIWNESHRGYHGQNHLIDLLEQIESMTDITQKERETLIISALFHDIVYDPKRTDNEEKSVEFFEGLCIDRNREDIRKVSEIILSTKTGEGEGLCERFNQIDRDILNRPFEQLLEYEQGVHKEFSFAGDAYVPHRVAFLEKMLDQYPLNSGNILRLIEHVKSAYEG